MRKRWMGAVLVVGLAATGCTNHLIKQESATLPGARDETARTFYRLATDCWKRNETLLVSGVVVENKVTLDNVQITARFDSFGLGVVNPFAQFLFTSSGSDTIVDYYAQEIREIGREERERQSLKWLRGDFNC